MSQIKIVLSGILIFSLLSLSLPRIALGASHAMGGVSDGGGNAVGHELFDFYENKKTKKITLEQLLALSPLAVQMLDRMEREVPVVGESLSTGLGATVKKALSEKAIYLENGDLDSPDCTNESFIAAMKIPKACQNRAEVRFIQSWFESHPKPYDINKAGLIIHELVLGWLQEIMPEMVEHISKEEMETKVRIITREIFAEKRNIAKVVKDTVGLYTLDQKNYVRFEAARKIYEPLAYKFCRDPRTDLITPVKTYFDDAQFMEWMDSLGTKYSDMENLQVWYKKLNSGKSSQEANAQFKEEYLAGCFDIEANYAPIHKPRMDKIPKLCIGEMLGAENQYREMLKEFGELSEAGQRRAREAGISIASMAAQSCTMHRAEQLEAINYFRFLTSK